MSDCKSKRFVPQQLKSVNSGSVGEMERGDVERRVYEVCRRCPYGADLMVAAFVQALKSYRRSSADRNDKDYQAAEEAVHYFPKLDLISSSCIPRDVTSVGTSSYVNLIQDIPLESLKLLYWLLHPRYRLELVQHPGEELSIILPSRLQMGYQGNDFNVASSPDHILRVQKGTKNEEDPKTEFETIKLSFGSMFAFHGTSAENLHSILRCGLLNLSNTILQRNGAIFGEGTYFSTDINVALSFSKAQEGWKDSCFGKKLQYVLLCEIAKGEKVFYTDKSGQSLRKVNDSSSQAPAHGSYIVVQNSDLIKTRYVYVYAEPRLKYESKLGIRTETTNNTACLQIKRLLGKQDWCRLLIVFYVILLLVISYFKSINMHDKRHVSLI